MRSLYQARLGAGSTSRVKRLTSLNCKTLRIALIAGTYQPEHCGVANYTACLKVALSQHNIQSVVLTTHTAAQIVNHPDVRGVVEDWRQIDLLPLVQAVHTTGADILHIQHAAGTYRFKRAIFLLPLLLRATGWRAPIVTTVHEYGWWEWRPKGVPPQLVEWLKVWGQQHQWWDREDGFLLTLSNAIITTNHDAETIILKRLPELTNRVYRIPIAANVEVALTDQDTARQLLRKKCNWSDETIIITFFGFLHPVKGLETLLPAFKQVQKMQPQARLLLVGGVESLALRGAEAKRYWERLHELVAELNLSQLVYLTGYVDAQTASHYLTGADIGVLPFNHGLTLKSGSLLTLLAHGLPVVATQAVSQNELSPDSLPIQLVPARNIEALASGLLKLLQNPAQRIQLGADGRTFSKNFNWQNIARSHLSVYARLTTLRV
ncbi:MAG: glycosyltransferase family 4 protein [Chroococcidiopsidaceae cyanobacterium CP_BM_ER_R8_30]|nr:glycosyltransferase family 4 protein [Chroococcidiopsidaceae cyanobacterium CP_BM_ER_R8_30]